ncbi:hypothetical protein N0V82_010141 [Gnomoniopsis sp. IMI 355080]|nr:hypothetical protein N0V82_010141 [Gnomoniopsis sp. IMI 355080]
MIDHLTLNTILNVVWYATNISFQYGQQQFHSIFTLFAPLAIPIYRYCFQNTPPPCYNFSLRKWITYALAYCFLLLLTRDTVEFMTLGNPFLDDILTLVRITLAVFWFSIIRHAGALYLAGWNGAARGLVRDLVDLAVGSKLPLGKALIVTGVTVRVFFLLGHVSGSPPPHPALVGTALLALTVYGICLLAVALGPFCWRRYIEPAMVCASDWTRLLTVTPARSIYRRGQTLVGNIQTHRLLVPFAFSSLVTLGVMAGFVAVGSLSSDLPPIIHPPLSS